MVMIRTARVMTVKQLKGALDRFDDCAEVWLEAPGGLSNECVGVCILGSDDVILLIREEAL